jgi:hypothetical protein
MEIIREEQSFQDTTELRQYCAFHAALLERVGLPLEFICLQDDRVISIHEFNYVEGEEDPLEWRSTWWSDEQFQLHRVRYLAVYPDGSRHTVIW